jgi:hypothetical protein
MQSQIDTFPCLCTWEWAKHIIIWNYVSDDQQVTKPKAIPMNHHQTFQNTPQFPHVKWGKCELKYQYDQETLVC